MILLALVLFWAWFKRTRTGIAIRATGSSENSAYLSGVPTRRTTTTAYALSGLFAALGGLFLVTQTASGSPTVGWSALSLLHVYRTPIVALALRQQPRQAWRHW